MQIEEALNNLLYLLGATLILLFLERKFPRVQSFTTASSSTLGDRWALNVGLYSLGLGLNRILAPLLYLAWANFQKPAEPASWYSVFIGVILLDFSAFFIHWLHHRVPMLWKLHRVHHSDSDLDVATFFRSHPLQWLSISVLELSIAILLKLPVESLLIFSFFLPFFTLWHHAALKSDSRLDRWFQLVLVTPSWHCVHHMPGNQRRNRHFGSIFSIWDRISHRGFFLVFIGSALLFSQVGCSKKKRMVDFSPKMYEEIAYGKELIEHTARYLGPKGSVMQLTTSHMNCQNCHLGAGTKDYGISFKAVHVRYPSYRAREGKVLTVVDRINNCMERPMNGKPLPLDGREIRAMQAYFYSLAINRPVAGIEKGDQLNDIVKFPARAADPERGSKLFQRHCIQCHGQDGQGKLSDDGVEFVYPPLWGPESFQAGSNMNRISKMASFIYANMPLGATIEKPTLTMEESFDVAAFVLDDRIHPRPAGRATDFPNLEEKPIDYARGPYIDGKSEIEHKFGPFGPIIENLRSKNLPVNY